MQHTATHCSKRVLFYALFHPFESSAMHCNTLQYAATHATHCNTLQQKSPLLCSLPSPWELCNIRQHAATHCNTLQHTIDIQCLWTNVSLHSMLRLTLICSFDNAESSLDFEYVYMSRMPLNTILFILNVSLNSISRFTVISTLCSTPQHTAAHCNTLQHAATHYGYERARYKYHVTFNISIHCGLFWHCSELFWNYKSLYIQCLIWLYLSLFRFNIALLKLTSLLTFLRALLILHESLVDMSFLTLSRSLLTLNRTLLTLNAALLTLTSLLTFLWALFDISRESRLYVSFDVE